MADGEEEVDVVPKRKILVTNIGGYVGKNVAKAFVTAEDEEVGWEAIGNLAPGDKKHKFLKEVFDVNNVEAFKDALRSAEVIVLDLLGQLEVAETALELLAELDYEEEKVLIGISTIMTWARTSPHKEEPDQPLTEEEYKRRRPHANFKQYLAAEKLVTKSKKDNLKTHVVCAGLMYGMGEDLFHDLFKTAWQNQPLPILSTGDGSNTVPTCHVNDVCSVVRKLAGGGTNAYVLAVDASKGQTFVSVTEAISNTLGIGKVTPNISKDEVLLRKDVEFFQVSLNVEPAAANDLGIEWHCQEGMVANIGKVVQEYREQRGLLPLRVLIQGPPASGKTSVAAAIAKEYQVPHIKVGDVIDEVIKSETESDLQQEAKAATGADGRIPDELVIKMLQAKLNTTNCTNQGFILDGYPKSMQQAQQLFAAPSGEGEGEEEAAEEEGEEGAESKKKPDFSPEFVVMLEAEDMTLRNRIMSLPQDEVAGTHNTEEGLTRRLSAYQQLNNEENPAYLLNLPAFQQIEALNLEAGGQVTPAEVQTKTKLYIGKPRNYGPTDEELAARAALMEADKAAKAEKMKQEAEDRERAEREERMRREQHEAERLAELQQQERELLEVRSIPLRNYLMENVIPTLTEGLIEVCKLRPEDPVDYLAEWLFKNNPVEDPVY